MGKNPRNGFACFLACVAGLAMTTASVAQTMQGSDAPPPMATASEAVPARALRQLSASQTATDTIMAKLNVPAAGLFRMRAPANSGIQVFVNGTLALDATGTRMETIRADITGILSLKPGDHLIEVRGITMDHPDWFRITLAGSGAVPTPLANAVERVDPQDAEAILQNHAMTTETVMADAPLTLAMAAPTERSSTSFVIGGTRSAEGRTASGTGESPAGGTISGGMRGVSTMGVSTMGIGGFGGSTNDGGGTVSRNMGGGPASAPVKPTPVMPTPVMPAPVMPQPVKPAPVMPQPVKPVPVMPQPVKPVPIIPIPKEGLNRADGGGEGANAAPPPAVAQISPLAPPANVVLTSAVQLTSAGGPNGSVPNTGATLFGAVMDNSMYDIVRVTIAPVNRTATVDVGKTTGQFAVRLFPEDFARGDNITVTLIGGSSGSANVASQPVRYQLRGMAVQDGVTQALSRLTYGATPELYAEVRAIGYTAFVEQQLNPEKIADTAFKAMNVDSLLKRTALEEHIMFPSILAHDLAHAAFSEKQLREVMAQFWMNHFHAVSKESSVRQQNIDDRAFYRENALGMFEDMLLYSARSPLMSVYLDNNKNSAGALNENYGREILELSSVGVNAGYNDNDVREVARIFSGWNFVRTNPDARGVAEEFEFKFLPNRHDTGNKTISFLNLSITGRSGQAGVQEGEELIAALSQNVYTRHHVCSKIVRLLVADAPPQAFIQSCADAWKASRGDVKAMLRAILLDPAYIGTAVYQRNKVRTPFEYVVAAVRALGAHPQGVADERFYREVREVFQRAGYSLLTFTPPTGLPEVAAAWASSGTFIAAYGEIREIVENPAQYGIDIVADIRAAGLETAEEVAAYLLTLLTADRFRKDEFDELVSVLKGSDGIFEPRGVSNEFFALRRALGSLIVIPSIHLQ